MEIAEFRVVVKARDFDATCRFYGEVMALPRLQAWDREDGRGALFQAGSAFVEVRGQARRARGAEEDEAFHYQGPRHKLTLTLFVESAQKAYEDLQFRDRNIPGGLQHQPDGALSFETHDPDGVKILLREARSTPD
jgi:catechol 2,3-dioxygenase-like lactoylglutathione lyase family enzyme